MKRIALFVGPLIFALIVGSLAAQTPGSLIVRGEFITSTGCMAWLNDEQALKKTGLCSFTIIAPSVKVTDLACSSVVVTYEDPLTSATAHDTVLNCTYKRGVISASAATPAATAGTLILPLQYTQALSDGCFTFLNHPALHCGFNVVWIGVALPGLTPTVTIGGGNTELHGSYPPIGAYR